MVVCVECLPADKPWDVVSVTRRSSGVAPWACVRVYARVLVWCRRIFTYILYIDHIECGTTSTSSLKRALVGAGRQHMHARVANNSEMDP